MSDDCIDDVGVTQDVTDVTISEDANTDITITNDVTTLDISCDEIVVEPTNELFTVDTYDEVVTVDVTDEVITVTTDCAQGPPGPPGVILWDETTSYLEGQVVFYDGQFYEALADNIGDQPDLFPLVWQVVAGGGGGAVDSVNGQTGVVVLDASDVGADPAGSASTAETNANAYTDTEIGNIDFPVDSVNGQTGVVVLDAGDVGADVAGSAGQALIDANNYTDTEISGLTFVEFVTAGTAVIVDNTDPQNPIISSTKEYSQYIYNPDRVQAGAVYNDWEDLVTAINDKGNAPSVINFTKVGAQTLTAAGAPYNLRNVTWRGLGGAPGTGPQLYLEDGFELTPMPYWNMEFGVAVYSQSTQPIFTTDYGTNFRLNLVTSGLGATNGCEAIRLNGGNGTLNIIFLDNGASLGGTGLGYEAIAATDAETMIIPLVLSGINSVYEEDSIRGGANSILLRFLNTIQQTGDPFPDQNNFTGTVLDQRGMPTLIGYDGTVSGLVANNIQAAIDELVTIIPSIPDGTMVNDVPTWNGTGYVPMPIQEKTTTLFDETTTPGVIYIGKAMPTGSAISEAGAVWAIKTIDTTADTEIKWADGVTTYTKIWDNRVGYSYY